MHRSSLFLLVLAASPAFAQQGPAPRPPGAIEAARGQRPPAQPDWTLTIGMAPVVSPVWQGSGDYAVSVFPDLRLNYRDDLFFSVPDGLGWNAINRKGWKIGPLAMVRFGRDDQTGGSPFLLVGGSDALQGMGDIALTGEFGGFAQKSLLRDRLRARASVRQGTGGHNGLVADTSLSWNGRRRDGRLIWSFGVRASFADAAFTNTFFGVDTRQAAASGLAPFTTGSGLVSAGVNSALVRPLGRRGRDGTLTLFTSYDRLGNVVAASSLIQERGTRHQASIGLAYGYRFGL